MNKKIFGYISTLFATIVLSTSLLLWANENNGNSELNIIQTDVVLDNSVRQEYLVGETIDTNGVSLKVGNDLITDLKINYDTSSAGVKKVEVSYLQNGNNYIGYYPITVLSIRHYDIRSYPSSFTTNEDGTTTPNGLVVWAELNAAPKEFPTVNNYATAIEIPSNMIETKLTINETNSSEYAVELTIGSMKLNYYCVELLNSTIILNSEQRILSFSNNNGTEERLTLYVTQIESNGNDGVNGALGYYLFEDALGNKELLDFSFYLNGYTSNFTSSSFNQGLVDSYDSSNEGYNVTYKGITFHAEKLPWHKAILDWNN